MTSRRRRGTRVRPSGRISIQSRDESLLRFVGRAGVVELPQIARAFWGDTPGARVATARRVRRLTDHGLLETSAYALHRPNRVTLTPLGAERVVSEGHALRTRIRAFSPAADHLVATAEVWSCLIARLSSCDGPQYLRFVTEAEIRRALGRTDRALIPDGLAVLGAAASSVTLALEIDLATELADVVFGAKARRYAPHLATRAPFHGLTLSALLVFARGQPRLRQLARAVSRTNAADRSFFQDLDDLTPGRVLEQLATVHTLAAPQPGEGPFTVSLLGGPS